MRFGFIAHLFGLLFCLSLQLPAPASAQEIPAPPVPVWNAPPSITSATADGACRGSHDAYNPGAPYQPPTGSGSIIQCHWVARQYGGPPESNTILPTIAWLTCPSSQNFIYLKDQRCSDQRADSVAPKCGDGATSALSAHDCLVGDPVSVATGYLIEKETDYASADGLFAVTRDYKSTLYRPFETTTPGFGQAWQGLVPGLLVFGDTRMTSLKYSAGNGSPTRTFLANDNDTTSWIYTAVSGTRARLTMVTTPSITRDAYFNEAPVLNGAAELKLEFLNGEYILYRRGPVNASIRSAVPIEHGMPSGYKQYFDYTDTGLFPNVVRDSLGRQMSLTWANAPRNVYLPDVDLTSQVIASVSLPDGTTLNYDYDRANWITVGAFTDTGGVSVSNNIPGMNDRLIGVRRTNSVGTVIWKRSYSYSDTRWPYALTSIKDANDAQVASFSYDPSGFVQTSARAGGVDAYTFSQVIDPASADYTVRDVTNPLGRKTRYRLFRDYFNNASQEPRSLTSVEGIATANVPADLQTIEYYGPWTKKMVSAKVDARGARTSFTADTINDRPDAVIEAQATPQERTTAILWHPTLDLPVRETKAGIRIDYTYSPTGQLLTRTETDTTTQTVPYSTAGQTRNWTYGWNSSGRLLSINGPKPVDANGKDDTLTFVYDAAGNLQTSTNGLGQVTNFAGYDVNGRPATMTDPNGIITAFAYDALGRAATVTVKHPTTLALNAITTFDYDVENRVIGLTSPATDKLFIDYNLAGQLTAVRMASGERIDFTNDAMGDVTAQSIKRSDTTAARTITRTFDEIGRMLTQTLGPGRTTTWAYDKNGNPTQVTSARNNATQAAFDPLNRLVSTVAPDTGATALAYNAVDAVTTHTDPISVQTTFVRNGFGEAIQEVSPDRGTSVFYYDAAGAVTAAIDGRGQRVDIIRDALGRVTKKTPVGRPTTEIISYAWDSAGLVGSYGIGRLANVTDGTGTTKFAYDHRGNLLTKQQKIGTTTAANRSYTYDLGDRIAQITYPSGRIVSYTRDTKGRVTTVQTKASSSVTTWTALASGIAYEPWGSMTAATLGNGLTMTQGWGNDGRLASKRLYKTSTGVNLSLLTYSYDNDDNINAITDGVMAANNVQYGYDVNGRLTQSIAATGTVKRLDTLYDKNGNRTAVQQRTNATDTTPVATDTYATTAGTNRLASITTTAGLRSIAYDARGNSLSEVRPASKTVAATYDGYGRLLTYNRTGDSPQTHVYNGLDDRVSVTTKPASKNIVTLYVYDGDGRLLGEYGASAAAPVAETIWLSPEVANDNQPLGGDDGVGGYAPLAVAVGSGSGLAMQWVHGGHLGVPLVTTNASGVAITPTGYTMPGFPGQLRTLSDIYYNRYRDYDSSTGRYIQADPIGLGGGANDYLYAGASPLRYTDPSGNCPWCVPILAGAAIGAAENVLIDYLIQKYWDQACTIDTNRLWAAAGYGAVGGALGGAAAPLIGRGFRYFGGKFAPRAAAESEAVLAKYGATPEGRPFTKHYGTETGPVRNIPGSVADNTINTTAGVPGRNGTTVHYDPVNNVTVVTGNGGSIMSVHKGAP